MVVKINSSGKKSLKEVPVKEMIMEYDEENGLSHKFMFNGFKKRYIDLLTERVFELV